MDPVTIALLAAAAIQAVSGLMQHYQSEKARKAGDKKLKEIEAMFNAIVPPEFDLKIWDDPKLAANIPGPALNMERITPKMYEQVGQFIPEMAAFVQEANPQLVEATQNAEVGRAAQMEALGRYRKIASGEFDPDFAAKMDESSMRSRRDAQTAQDNILQDAQSRGQMGSGLMLASQMNRTSDGMQRQALESRMAAAESYRNQLSALDSSAALGGRVRDSEMGEQAQNASIINDFNQRTSKRYQDYLNNRTNVTNSARDKNLSEAQRISDGNTGLENKARIDQVERYNRGQEANYDAAWNNRKNALGIEGQKNDLKQRMYENLMQKTRGKAGLGEVAINRIDARATDANNTTRGVADSATAGAMMYGKYKSAKDEDGIPPQEPYYGYGGGADYSGRRVYPGEDDRMGVFK